MNLIFYRELHIFFYRYSFYIAFYSFLFDRSSVGNGFCLVCVHEYSWHKPQAHTLRAWKELYKNVSKSDHAVSSWICVSKGFDMIRKSSTTELVTRWRIIAHILQNTISGFLPRSFFALTILLEDVNVILTIQSLYEW